MSSRDRDSKSLQDKLKNYFKLRGPQGTFPQRVDFALTAEVEREISPETPPGRRLKAIRDLSEKVVCNRLENRGVERIWMCVRDLLEPEQPRENRHTVLGFLRCLIQGQYEQLNIMRGLFFRFIKGHDVPDDSQPRFEMLQSLTENGKDIKCFEEEIGRFLLDWMPKMEMDVQIKEFLELIVNLVKFNAAYLDDDIVSDIVNNTCYLCCYSGVAEVVLLCLQVLEAVVSYSIFPHDVLHVFVAALCRTVNVEHYCQISWKIMRNMLGTDLGHAALYETVNVLKTAENDAGLTRGAVFYINMALWGSKRVSTLKATHTSVLPAFLKALESEQSVVIYEVILALQSLISRHGSELHETPWDMVFTILRKIICQVEAVQTPNTLIVSHLHEAITAVEQLHEQRIYIGNVHSMYALIDRCGHMRPESSVVKLINWRASQITPMRIDWLAEMSQLLDRYCRQETRVNIRTHVLHTVHDLVQTYRCGYEEELLDRVMLPHLQHSAGDADPHIRCITAKLLVELAEHCQSKGCSDLLDIMEKVLNRPFELYVTNEAISLQPDTNISDIKMVVEGLVKIFHLKLMRLPSSHAVRIYLIMVGHLEKHYGRPSLFEYHPSIRMKILELFLSARANTYCHIGFSYDANDNPLMGAAAMRVKPVFSPYVCVEGGNSISADGTPKVLASHSPGTGGHQQNTSSVSIRKACKLIILCLKQEKDWTVLQMVLREIPSVMQSKPLILSKHNNDIDMLASALCSMVADKTLNLPESLRLPPGTKLGRSEFHGQVLPVLACLAPYHANLDPLTQQKIIKCLTKFGLVLRSHQCISALTIYTLETRDTMLKLLPDLLLDLSKISDTSHIAVSILEFLSTLTRLPKLFASFVADQYMSVFAILLPYTNPSRYNHYVVSLAHHVIAAWFLKCRLSYRRDFVKFIIHGLLNYTILPFEEAKFKRISLNVNEDSSNRMRSSSLGSKGREPINRGALAGVGSGEPGSRSANAAFHLELTETCIDLLARYTFSPCSIRPRRGPMAEFMFNGGQSTTWVVGHKVVTITTSGCLQNSLKQGLCDRCSVLCKQHTDSVSSPSFLEGNNSEPKSDIQNNTEIKRYTKYTLQHSRSAETSSSSFSMSDNSLQPPSVGSGQTTRQNSSENKSQSSDSGQPNSPKIISEGSDTQAQLSLKLENLAKQEERGSWSRVERQMGAGTCVCWCSGWAEVHIRRPTGDVSWVMRMQNQMNFDSLLESPLNDIMGLLAPSLQGTLNSSSSRSSGLGDSRNDILSDTDPRSRSGSSSSQNKSTQYSPGATGGSGALQPQPPPPDLQKSNSDSVVAPGGGTVEKKPPHASTHCIVPPSTQHAGRSHVGTEPINIPGSPQRQSSSSTTTDDDDAIPPIYGQGKSRHPVRRSNSSPEMSSSWKNPFHHRERLDGAGEPDLQPPLPGEEEPSEMLLLPSVEPTTMPVSHHHQKKSGKNKDMRVSCEAIPEEMFSSGGTPPSVPSSQPHPHLMTYNSDPGQHDGQTGSQPAGQTNIQAVSSDTALNALAAKSSTGDLVRHTNAYKASSENVGPQEYKTLLSKPPHSPVPPPSPGRSARVAVQGKQTNVTLKLTEKQQDRDDLPPLSRSKRSNTISVMSPTRKRRDNPSPKPREGPRPSGGGGVAPAFVMLQLYYNMNIGNNLLSHDSVPAPDTSQSSTADWIDRPLKVYGIQYERSIKNLDHIPPLETYRVGVLYVGPGQADNETKILRNEFGSLRYADFLRDLGTLIPLEDADKHGLYLNLEKGGKDGHFTYVWQDDIMQVHFHVATLMPNSPTDPTANEKRKHIGNDYVSIVYNDSGVDFNIHTIKGQFNFCIVIVEPLDHGINRVTIKTKDERIERKFLLQGDYKVISDQNVALLARQLALHCNLASLISRSLNESEHFPYASNSLERLRTIKRLRARLIEERISKEEDTYLAASSTLVNRRLDMNDFTEYT